MKICLDVRYLVRSGSSSYIAHVVPRILASDSVNEYYLVKYASQRFSFEKEAKGVFVCHAHQNITRMLWMIFVLPLRMAKAKIDIYHGMKFPGPPWSTTKVVNTLHSISSRYRGYFPRSFKARLFQLYANPLLRRSAAIIAVSHFLSDFAVNGIKADPKSVHVIYHGVDASFHLTEQATVDEAKRARGLTRPYFICVGNVFPVKNQITAVRALADLGQDFDGDLVIAGGTEDPYCAELKQEAQRLGVADRVRLTGFLRGRELTALMNGAIAALLPSLTEGFGMAMVEAFRCGLPVIASSVGSLSELGENCALLVDDPQDHKRFAGFMKELLSSPGLLKEIRLRSIERGSKFSWETAAAEHVRVYQSLAPKP